MKAKLFWEIGKIVERTHFSIQRVINNYTSSKSIISKPRSGRPSKLTAREKRYVFKSIFSLEIKCTPIKPFLSQLRDHSSSSGCRSWAPLRDANPGIRESPVQLLPILPGGESFQLFLH
ncbi:hypothetical protein CEXT_264691 [Caerostris extrusa]|uniref:Transposase n=1 Tax=Caerostris extrusa TaxID=172846 RepID=A0AAV4U1U3_CAEEX|nr:hypothetical protein CEXT_264691 [Caerostris extrusa]